MATYTHADKQKMLTAIWALITEYETEYAATRATLVSTGRFYYGHPLLRSLTRRIDALKVQSLKLA